MDQRGRSGMTLIEIMVAHAIAGVVTAMSAPVFTGMFSDQRVKGAARDVADALMLGRAEAIRTGNTGQPISLYTIWNARVQGNTPDGATSRLQATAERCHAFNN